LDDLEFEDTNSCADGEGVQLANWTVGWDEDKFESCVKEVPQETLNCGRERKDGDASAVRQSGQLKMLTMSRRKTSRFLRLHLFIWIFIGSP
jgi:hypothetical protein